MEEKEEFSILNGYLVKDATARDDIATLQTDVSDNTTNIQTLQTDNTTIKADITELKARPSGVTVSYDNSKEILTIS